MVHRDVKPSNLMRTRQGQIKILDFGIVGCIEPQAARLTATGALMGTEDYMSPEQAAGDTALASSDVFSAGVVLYELLTGHLPFDGCRLGALCWKNNHIKLVPPSYYRPDLDPEAEAVCLTAMAKDPEHRYRSGKELAAALTAPVLSARIPVRPTAKPGSAAQPPSVRGSAKTVLRRPSRPSETAAHRPLSAFDTEAAGPALGQATMRPSAPARGTGRTETGRWNPFWTNWLQWGAASLVVVGLAATAAVCMIPPRHAPAPPSSEAKAEPPHRPGPVVPPVDDARPPAETTTIGKALGVAKGKLTFAADGGQRTVTVPGDARILIDGKNAKLDEVQTNGTVVVTSRGDVVTKVEVKNPPPPEITFAGQFLGAENGQLTATVDSQAKTFTVPNTAEVTIDGKTGRLEDVKKDSELTITARADIALKVEVKSPVPPPRKGIAEAYRAVFSDAVIMQLNKLGDPTTASVAKIGGKEAKFRKILSTELHMGSLNGYGFLARTDGRELVNAPSGAGGFGSNRANLKVAFCEWDAEKEIYKDPISVPSNPSERYPGSYEYKTAEDVPGVFVVVPE